MTERQPDDERDRLTDHRRSRWERRKFLAIGGGVGATLFAGCTSDSLQGDDPDDGSDDDSDDDSSGGSNFRLLVSDRPADIDDFDSLEVTFDSARVFQGGEDAKDDDAETDGDDESGDAEETETETEDEPDGEDDDATSQETEEGDDEDPEDEGEDDEQEAETEDDEESEDDAETEADDGEGSRGFVEFDLDDPTVDLTEVVGERAMAVTEGHLEEGTYQKLELNVSDVEGIVDGEAAEVKVPSEKLQLTKPFEIREGETVDFVFDINVVKRGNEESYNLKPVISKSGVVGEDVEEHEEVGDEAEDDEDDETEDDEAEDADDDGTESDDDDGTDADENGDDGESTETTVDTGGEGQADDDE